MGFCKKILLLIACFMLAQFAGGDELLFEKRFEGVQKVEFSPHGRGHYGITNVFLQKISEANGKLRVFTSYSINYGIEAQLARTGEESAELNLFLTGLKIDGDILYRDFVIDNILFPAQLKLVIKTEANDKQSTIELNTKVPAINEEKQLIHTQPIVLPLNDISHFDIQLSGILFHYDEAALKKFKTWEQAFFSYYESVEKLDRIDQQLSLLNLGDPGRLIIEEFRFCEAEKIFWDVYHAPFRQLLDLGAVDPEGFKDRFDPLKDSVLYYREEFNYMLSRLDALFYYEGLQGVADNNNQVALKRFGQAIIYNPVHVYSHLGIAGIYLKSGEIDSAANVVVKVLNKLHPNGAYLDSTFLYVERIFDSYFAIIDSLNNEGRHTEALKVTEKAMHFDHKVQALDYSADIDRRFTDSYTGVYESFLGVIGRAITVISHSYALTYIDHAVDYQNKHRGFIRCADRVYVYLEQLVDRLTVSGRKLYVMKDFRGAEAIFSDIKQICEKYPVINCEDNISDYYALARQARIDAELITVEITIKEPLPEMSDDDVIEKVREDMIKKLSHGHLKAWAGETHVARDVLEEIAEKSSLYGLRSDSLINARLVSLSKRLREKECELAERELSGLFEQYHKLVGLNEFVRAKSKLVKAEELNEKMQECDFEIDTIIKERERISPVVIYQGKMTKIRDLYFSQAHRDYEFFAKSYIRADSYYKDNNLKVFGLPHKTLYEFIESSTDHGLIKYGASYYADEGKPLKALKMLNMLKDMGVERESTSGIQEYAGKMAAKHYSVVSPESSPREFVAGLTNNDRWLRQYNRAFINNWKP